MNKERLVRGLLCVIFLAIIFLLQFITRIDNVWMFLGGLASLVIALLALTITVVLHR